MWTRLRPLLEPMNLAAYLAWGAIGSLLWNIGAPRNSPIGLAHQWQWLVVLHAAFLVLFVLRELASARPTWVRALVLAQLLVALVASTLSPFSALPVLLVIAMAQLASVLAVPALAITFVAANALMFLVLRNLWHANTPMFSVLLNTSFQLFAMVAAWYAVSAQRSRDQLAVVNVDLMATRSLLADRARDSERLRLSRELHDVAGHKLTALKLNLAALRREQGLSQHESLGLCARLADELLGDIRALVRQMRLHDGVALDEMLQRLGEPFPRPRLRIDMDPNLRVPNFEHAEAVLRTVQEALTNAARHGGADNLWLRVQQDGDRLQLELRDDGRGGGGELRFGAGLTGMRERLEAVGGGVEVSRVAEGGVRLSAWLPVTAAA
ncbi:sensor histidine kinase [soil metagenome]